MAFSRWQYWRRFNLPNVVYLLILIAIAGGSYWWVRKDMSAQTVVQNQPLDRMDGYAESAELTQTSDNGKLMYQATMNHIEHFGNQNLSGQDVVLVSTVDGQPKVVVKAQKAIWNSAEKIVDLSGSVFLQRESDGKNQDMTLTTEKMQVHMNQGLASSDEAFVMTNGASTVTGKRFRYDYQLRDLEMGGGQTDAQPVERIKAEIVNAVRK
ncbi:MAG: lptC [Burkholderiaceae bacterium]|nr:lptC [Burkholderiaceae bacterium]